MSNPRSSAPGLSLPYRVITGAIGAVSLAAAITVGIRPTGPVPPLGLLLDPAHGVWALATRAEHPRAATLAIPSLTAAVDVRYDDRGVAHIFATNELDAMRAQGFVVARDRLFQLELQTRAAAGTLTELVGARALEADRDTRAIGLPWGARRKLEVIEQSPESRAILQAYADGINAYIAQMGTADLPLEYRLLGRRPQHWELEHTMLLLERMGQTLAWSDFELERAVIEARIGRAATDALYPIDAWVQEPIHANAPTTPRVRTGRIPPPVADPTAANRATIAQSLLAQIARIRGDHDGVLGSNNWAVAPSRSASGKALLANDPHLALSLPSIWYEVHLVVPDTLDAYGVTFPGAPGILLGVNRHIAWGTTNVGADALDYYIETVDDSLAPTRYQLDGAWEDLVVAPQAYRGPDGRELFRDTVRYTHRGPMVKVNDAWVSRRWMVLEPSKDFEAFRAAMHAGSVDEFFAAMSTFTAPAQNFIVADQQGHIGIRSTGQYPIRPGNGRGDRFFDGSTRAADWTGYITPATAPQVRDPQRGYIVSANQQPVDPATYPAYLGNEWPAPWRAMHINALLHRDSAVTPDAMRRYQTDPGNARADAFAPLFITAGQRALRAGSTDSALAPAIEHLRQWDRQFTLDNTGAVLFEAAMRQLATQTWDELRRDTTAAADAPTTLLSTPTEDVLLALTTDPTNAWWDRRGTAPVEQRDDILVAALTRAYSTLERDLGPAPEGGWTWSKTRVANIWHPLRLEALSALRLPVVAGRESINPSSGDGVHGASWRLVAEVGEQVVARGIYPGGQSANPVSPHYRDRIETWRRGELDSLRIPATADALTATHHRATLTLVPRR